MPWLPSWGTNLPMTHFSPLTVKPASSSDHTTTIHCPTALPFQSIPCSRSCEWIPPIVPPPAKFDIPVLSHPPAPYTLCLCQKGLLQVGTQYIYPKYSLYFVIFWLAIALKYLEAQSSQGCQMPMSTLYMSTWCARNPICTRNRLCTRNPICNLSTLPIS